MPINRRRSADESVLSVGKKQFAPHQCAVITLARSEMLSSSKGEPEAYTRFRVPESQLEELLGQYFTNDLRWELVSCFNDLGWDVVVSRNYWGFIRNTIPRRWQTVSDSPLKSAVEAIKINSDEEVELYTTDVNYDASDIAIFYHGSAIEGKYECMADELDEEQLIELGLDYLAEDELEDHEVTLIEYYKMSDFSIWQHLYFQLVRRGVIEDVYQQATDIHSVR